MAIATVDLRELKRSLSSFNFLLEAPGAWRLLRRVLRRGGDYTVKVTNTTRHAPLTSQCQSLVSQAAGQTIERVRRPTANLVYLYPSQHYTYINYVRGGGERSVTSYTGPPMVGAGGGSMNLT